VERKFPKLFSFIGRFRFVEDGPGGTYLSGKSSNPASRRHLRIDPSIGVGRSFPEVGTGCVGQSCPSSIRESRCTEECPSSGKTGDLGGQSTSIETVSLRRGSQIIRWSRVRLFRHDLVCPGSGWFDQHTDELNRVSQLRRTRRRQMDNDLRAGRSHVRSHCRASTRHDAVRSLHRQMGAALVWSLPSTAWLRREAPCRVVVTWRTKRCEDASQSTARRAKCMQDADFLSRKLWECARVSASLWFRDVTV